MTFLDNIAVLIESDWNLKQDSDQGELLDIRGINRIRLEFKAYTAALLSSTSSVLIESYWNLKGESNIVAISCYIVLIESDWNLKN